MLIKLHVNVYQVINLILKLKIVILLKIVMLVVLNVILEVLFVKNVVLINPLEFSMMENKVAYVMKVT